jgi:hypothetical protein
LHKPSVSAAVIFLVVAVIIILESPRACMNPSMRTVAISKIL